MGLKKESQINGIKRILVANRGEISCRIQTTCHRLGIETIAVGSSIEEDALHMEMADHAVVIGTAETRDSYLNSHAIIQTALQYDAQAIHPGYGFLSENADFAEDVRKAGLIFIGPSSTAIRAMGSKTQAKSIAESVHVPVICGYQGEGNLLKEAKKLGFPLLIKASYGGGGKGMRRVNEVSNFDDAVAACRREAMAAFGNDQVMLEKYLVRPRHIEVQILADSFGKCIVLSDRDCSLQRRHQKVIEEAPAPNLSAPLRTQLHEAAICIAKSVAYESLGTVEFLVTDDDYFYFLEMNTRLQVEHPVTELVLGLDVVELQIRVAAGEPLSLQENQHPQGHAVEARLYAEDGDNDFLPSTGIITNLKFPNKKNLRVDTGSRAGDAVTIYYDPMIAKLIVWGQNRDEAIKGLSEALFKTQLRGIKTNQAFLQNLLCHPGVSKGVPDIDFIDRYVDHVKQGAPEIVYILAALWFYNNPLRGRNVCPWRQFDGWRLNTPSIHNFPFVGRGTVSIRQKNEHLELQFEGKNYQIYLQTVSLENEIHAFIDGNKYHGQIETKAEEIHVYLEGMFYSLKKGTLTSQEESHNQSAGLLTSPMPGRVVSVMVTINESVEMGQPLVILEAMKMEHTIRAPHNGIVDFLPFSSGDFCEEGVELIRLRSLY